MPDENASHKGEVYAHLHKVIDYLAFADQDRFQVDPKLGKIGWVLNDKEQISVDLEQLFTLTNLNQNDLNLAVVNMTAAMVRGDRVRATAVMLWMLGKNSIEAKGRKDLKEIAMGGASKITENVALQRFRKIRYSLGGKGKKDEDQDKEKVEVIDEEGGGEEE